MAKNEMLNYFIKLKGNPKACISCEPLWFIPYSLYSPFATIYMSQLGLSDIEIGSLLTIGMIVQVFAAFLGGALTDKFGRRKTTLASDLISWSIPCLIWAFSQNYIWFLVAAVFNSVWQVSNISWAALLVEDSEPDKLVYAYSWINIASVLSVFVAPISFLLMDKFDVVTVVRCLYVFSFLSMTAKFLLLYFFSHETEVGKQRIKETKDVPITKLLMGYKDIFIKIIKSREMMTAFAVMLSYNITNTAVQNFFGLYATDSVGIKEGYLAVFSMISAAVTLILMFTLQNKLNRLKNRPVMLFGYFLFVADHLMLVFCPQGSITVMTLYSIVNALAIACVSPRKDSLSAQFVDKKERSRVTAIIYMLMIGITSPFGILIGALSQANRAYPFVMNIVIFTITMILILFSKEIKTLDSKHDLS